MSKYAGFNTVQLTKPQRSQFDLSHTKRITTRAGRLTPVFVSEAIPGDTFNGSSEILVRVAPLLAPIYDELRIYVHFFFVPYRLLWDEWETFITGGRLGVGVDPNTAPIPPYYKFEDLDAGSYTQVFEKSHLLDYLGMPLILDINGGTLAPFAGTNASFDAMVPYAFQKIWMDYYRDRNFIADDYMEFPIGSGDQMLRPHDPAVWLGNKTRAWEHDYFTSSLPFTQRGEEVLMPLAGSGTVTYMDQSSLHRYQAPHIPAAAGAMTIAGGATPGIFLDSTGNPSQVRNIDEVLLESSDVSINDFRTAYALQVWLERNAIAGSRYNESTQAHFGVRPQDSRLQRAEYIGGGLIPIKISEIVSTAYSDNGSGVTVPLANLAGHGITYGNTNNFHYFCPEHGVILGIASIMSPPSYHQGMPRWFRRKTFLDYPWPTFAKLGEQTIDKSELYANALNLTEDINGELPMFGYTSRYADWKFLPNSTHGDFHNDLLFWTLTRDFESSPELGYQFTLYTDSIQDRIFAVNGDIDNFWLYVYNHVNVRRALPYFGTPNTLGFA